MTDTSETSTNDQPEIPRPEYPRPILVRKQWLNLNGTWDFMEDQQDQGLVQAWYQRGLPEGKQLILVPFTVESEASGLHNVNPASIVWYARNFDLPDDWGNRVVLRVGAADHWSRIFINGQEVGQHRGGYAPFALDISHALKSGSNTVVIRIEDSLSWTQPRGKQAGTTRWPIDYDAVTGIWQTVWLEPLPGVSIESTQTRFSISDGTLTVTTLFSECVEGKLTVSLSRDGESVVSEIVTVDFRPEVRVNLAVPEPALWSPESPSLYDLNIKLTCAQGADEVQSYTGLREIDVLDGKLVLNGEPLYLRGVLDQGYFPRGWYTALTDDALKQDVELTLAMGFNCARKHQKAEDPRYLYWADKLGLLVWAEMPSGKIFSTELIETLTSEWIDLVKRDRANPSVIAWVPFNESWGVWHQSARLEQRHFVDAITALTRSLDTYRPVIGNDGWEYSSGDLWTLHLYDSDVALADRIDALVANPSLPVAAEGSRDVRVGALQGADVTGLPILLTECGGIGFGHYGEEDFSYGDLPSTEVELGSAIQKVADTLQSAASLQGFVWTQLTDIQQEINGLLYFDRSPKLPIDQLHSVFSRIGKSEYPPW